jgi:hypothetical protein
VQETKGEKGEPTQRWTTPSRLHTIHHSYEDIYKSIENGENRCRGKLLVIPFISAVMPALFHHFKVSTSLPSLPPSLSPSQSPNEALYV